MLCRKLSSRRPERLYVESLERRDLLTTLELTASIDSTLYEDSTGTLSNGSGEYIFAGRTAQADGLSLRRGLIAFDVAGVPAGATIDSVSVTLNLSRTITEEEPVSLHRVMAQWGEGTSDAPGEEGRGTTATTDDVTWRHRMFPLATWRQPGGEFQAQASASTQVGGDVGEYLWSSDQLLADVERWIQTPAENFGWILLGNEAQTGTAKRFHSSESGNAAARPTLTIEFTEGTATPSVSISDQTMDEGNAGTTVLNFPVTLTSAPADDVTIAYAIAAGTATFGEDFDANNGTLTFTPNGPLTQNIQVSVTGDTLVEADETFFVTLTAIAGANLADGEATGTIVNDDDVPIITIQDISINEGSGVNSVAQVPVRLSAASSVEVTVEFTTVEGTANDSDFVATDGTLTFDPGETEKTIDVTVIADAVNELNESFSVELSNPINADLATVFVGRVNISDDDVIIIQAPWRNARLPLDVSGDGAITPRDALLIINYINTNGAGGIPNAGNPPPYYDVTGDNAITPRDALSVISFLNNPPPALRAAVSAFIASALEDSNESWRFS